MNLDNKIYYNEIESDMKIVTDTTLMLMCNSGGFPSLICSEDKFWVDRMLAKNPSVYNIYSDLMNIPGNSFSPYEFYKTMINAGIMENIIYPIYSEKNIKKPTVYFLIDLNIDPVKYPYNIRIDNDTKKSDSKNLGYFVIPDVILIKKDNLYRIIKFPRGINNSEFHEILKSTQATYISELEIQGTLEGYESMGIFGVKNDFSSIFQRLKSREIVNVVNK